MTSVDGASRQLRSAVLVIGGLLVGCALAQPFPSNLLDSVAVVGPDADGAGSVHAAFCDSTGLAVWSSDHGLVKACAITSQLMVIDSIPIVVNDGPPADGCGDIAAGEAGYLVVWTREYAGYPMSAVAGAITDRSGHPVCHFVLDSTLNYFCSTPSVAFDGANFLVAWCVSADPVGCGKFARVSQDGEVLDRPAREFMPGRTGQYSVRAAFGGGRYMLACDVDSGLSMVSDVLLARVDTDGSVKDSAGILLRHDASLPAIAWNGSNFVVISGTDTGYHLVADLVSTDGAVVDSGMLVSSDTLSPPWDVTAAGDTALVVWSRFVDGYYTEVHGARLDGGGRLLDSVPLPLSSPAPAAIGAVAARCGDGFAAFWANTSDTAARAPVENSDIAGRLVSVSGGIDSAVSILSLSASRQFEGAVASDGNDFLAVWVDLRAETGLHDRTLRACRFNSQAEPLGNSFRIAGGQASLPALAFGGGCYAVAWRTDSGAMMAARISPDGALLDSPAVTLATGLRIVESWGIAYADSVFLVVWDAMRRVNGCRLSPGGALLDSVPRILQVDTGRSERYPRVASDGHEFFVIRRCFSPLGYCITAQRVSTAGTVLDTGSLVIALTDERSQPRYLVTYGGGRYLVIDDDYREAYRPAYAVAPDGSVVSDTVDVWPLLGGLSPCAATFDGLNFQMVSAWGSQILQGVWGARVTPDCVPVDTVGFRIAVLDNALQAENVAVAVDSTGNLGVLFFSYEAEPLFASRARACCFQALTSGIDSRVGVGRTARLRVRPLPASEYIDVDFDNPTAGNVRIDLLDVVGRGTGVAAEIEAGSTVNSVRLSVGSLPAGVYFVRLAVGGYRASQKVLLAR